MPQAQYCSITLAAERYLRHRILDLRLRDIGILGQGPCAGSMQYCNKNTCFACLKYWNIAPQHLGYWDTGNTVKYSNSPCLLEYSKTNTKHHLWRGKPASADGKGRVI